MYQRAEDPAFVIANGIPLDTEYYVSNQVIQPLVRLFEPMYKETEIKKMLLRDTYASTATTKASTKANANAAGGKKSAMSMMLAKGRQTLKKNDMDGFKIRMWVEN